jgi:hypothetical protein
MNERLVHVQTALRGEQERNQQLMAQLRALTEEVRTTRSSRDAFQQQLAAASHENSLVRVPFC